MMSWRFTLKNITLKKQAKYVFVYVLYPTLWREIVSAHMSNFRNNLLNFGLASMGEYIIHSEFLMPSRKTAPYLGRSFKQFAYIQCSTPHYVFRKLKVWQSIAIFRFVFFYFGYMKKVYAGLYYVEWNWMYVAVS